MLKMSPNKLGVMGMMKAGIITLLLLLAVAPLALAGECPAGMASGLVPAVIGEKGQMLEITVESRPGDGQIYMSANPYVGISTQNSERTAVSIATRLLDIDKDTCDFFVRISRDLGGAEAVDGPSAGAAMTLLAVSALSGADILPNAAATGTIETDGTIGAVGGVGAKARAAAESGVEVFITPRLTIYERLLLNGVKKDWNITVIEARDIYEAGKIAFSNETPEEGERDYKFTIVPADVPQSSLPTGGKFSRFGEIARKTLEGSEARVERALEKGDGEFDYYFRGEINASRTLLEKGYTYSAANLAFLTQIDASVLETSATAEEVERVRAEVAACVYGAEKPKITMDNYEEVFGGEVRMAWARKKLAEADGIEVDGEEVAVFVLNELEYAKGWCTLAGQLYSAPASGKALDEGALDQLAFAALNGSWKTVQEDNEDAVWHMEASEEAFRRGDYGAALYDATYAYSSVIAEEELARRLPNQIQEDVNTLNIRGYAGLWPALYQSQARYYALGETPSTATAFRLAVFADQLAETQSQINGKLLADAPEEEGAQGSAAREDGTAGAGTAFLTLVVIGALLVLVYEAHAALAARGRR